MGLHRNDPRHTALHEEPTGFATMVFQYVRGHHKAPLVIWLGKRPIDFAKPECAGGSAYTGLNKPFCISHHRNESAVSDGDSSGMEIAIRWWNGLSQMTDVGTEVNRLAMLKALLLTSRILANRKTKQECRKARISELKNRLST